MTIIESMQWRYATKKFDSSKSLTEQQLQLLKEAFNLTAISYGLQTLKLIVIEDKDKREALVQHSFGQRQVVDASHLLVLCVQNDINDKDVESHFNNVVSIRNTPETVIAPFKSQLKDTIEHMSQERKLSWATNQAYIALGNLMTVCAVEKIDSCPMEGFDSETYDDVLGLRALGLKSVLLLPVGFRAEDDMFADFKKVRKPISETVIDL
ncbi:MAG: NAD(P)H-dependent oxidoreductase [Bacteroidota bacterium]